jgi:DNA-binding beta-propeller fold protein YncE
VGRFAFTSLEGTGAVQVSDLARALSAGFGASGVRVGQVPAPLAPVGEAVSPDGRWLYVTSEERGPARGLRGPVTGRRCPGDPDSLPGVVRVIGVAAAERDPATAVRAGAGSSPVRVVLSPGGKVAWVTARGSNALLGFATSRVVLVDGGRLAVDWKIRLADAIADNASSGGVVLGSSPVPLGAVDLRLAGCTLHKNGGLTDAVPVPAGTSVAVHFTHLGSVFLPS